MTSRRIAPEPSKRRTVSSARSSPHCLAKRPRTSSSKRCAARRAATASSPRWSASSVCSSARRRCSAGADLGRACARAARRARLAAIESSLVRVDTRHRVPAAAGVDVRFHGADIVARGDRYEELIVLTAAVDFVQLPLSIGQEIFVYPHQRRPRPWRPLPSAADRSQGRGTSTHGRRPESCRMGLALAAIDSRALMELSPIPRRSCHELRALFLQSFPCATLLLEKPAQLAFFENARSATQ